MAAASSDRFVDGAWQLFSRHRDDGIISITKPLVLFVYIVDSRSSSTIHTVFFEPHKITAQCHLVVKHRLSLSSERVRFTLYLFGAQHAANQLYSGTDQSQGRGQIVSNINACLAVQSTIKSTLGPYGGDLLLVDENGKQTITNDGATVMKLLDIVHPAARILTDIARSQDAEVGDGTTSVVVLAGEILKEIKEHVEHGVSSQTIIKGLRRASTMAVNKIREIAVDTQENNQRETLRKLAATSMSSKLIHRNADFFTKSMSLYACALSNLC